jgi:hypothetical protein
MKLSNQLRTIMGTDHSFIEPLGSFQGVMRELDRSADFRMNGTAHFAATLIISPEMDPSDQVSLGYELGNDTAYAIYKGTKIIGKSMWELAKPHYMRWLESEFVDIKFDVTKEHIPYSDIPSYED